MNNKKLVESCSTCDSNGRNCKTEDYKGEVSVTSCNFDLKLCNDKSQP